MSKNPKIKSKLDILSNSKSFALADNSNSFEEVGRVLVKGFTSKSVAHIAVSFLKFLNENKINCQRLLRVEDKKIYLEFLPVKKLKNLREIVFKENWPFPGPNLLTCLVWCFG
jgi:hypothetical protein